MHAWRCDDVHAAAWDCVACCFFLDTARNVLTYLEVYMHESLVHALTSRQAIFNMLKPGGLLINLGPLLYHFDDNDEAPSLELSFEELRAAMLGIGFAVEVRAESCDVCARDCGRRSASRSRRRTMPMCSP